MQKLNHIVINHDWNFNRNEVELFALSHKSYLKDSSNLFQGKYTGEKSQKQPISIDIASSSSIIPLMYIKNKLYFRFAVLPAVVLFFLLSISCQSSLNYVYIPKTISSLSESDNSVIKLGACQAGLSNTVEEQEFMSEIGVEWLRGSIPWSRVEKTPGVWDFEYYDKYMELAEKYNKKVLVVLAYDVPWIYKTGDTQRNITPDKLPYYLNYVETVVRRFGNQAAGFEIWNEPNNSIFWNGSDIDFFQLTKQTVNLIKSILPDTTVAVGSILYNPFFGGKNYLKKMIKEGVLENADVLALHPYGLSVEKAARRVSYANRLLQKHGYNMDIWITEMGFTTGGIYLNKTSVIKQANAVIESIVRLSAAGADLITWFKLFDGQLEKDIVPGISSEEFFGLAYPDYTLKPSGKSYSLIAKVIGDSIYIPDGIFLEGISNSRLEIFRFDKINGISNIVLWSKGETQTIDVTGLKQPVSITNLITGKVSIPELPYLVQMGTTPLLITGEIPE